VITGRSGFMFINLMKVFEYDETGWNCQESQIVAPKWEQVESAVRRLEKFRFPFVWFFLSASVPDNAVPDFEIIGGEGDFAVAGSDGGQHRLIRSGVQGNEPIDVWLSDQGTTIAECFVFHDIEAVLLLLRQFAESGGFGPNVSWK